MRNLEDRAGVFIHPADLIAVHEGIDSSFHRIMKYREEPLTSDVDRKKLYEVLGEEGLSLPRILTNNPYNDRMKFRIQGQQRAIRKDPTTGLEREVDTRSIVLLSFSSHLPVELNPYQVFYLHICEPSLTVEGFMEREQESIDVNGRNQRQATLQDLQLADLLLKRYFEFQHTDGFMYAKGD
jgi:hypothetical protein